MRHQHTACPSNGKIGTVALLVLAGALLAGCETTGGPKDPVSELVAFSGGAQASARSSRPDDKSPTEKPKSRAQIAMDCWAMAEKSRAGSSLEARGDFVTDCIEKRLNPGSAEANAKPPKGKQRQPVEAKPSP